MALPALEYCNLERASRLLNCEITDIVHWWLIGMIELHICLNDQEAILIGNKKQNKSKGDAFLNEFKIHQDLMVKKTSIFFKSQNH